MDASKKGIDRFLNEDQNFSIGWYPNIKSLYNATLEQHLASLEKFNDKKSKASPKDTKHFNEAKAPVIDPMFVIAHELFDALPIHQFKYLGSG